MAHLAASANKRKAEIQAKALQAIKNKQLQNLKLQREHQLLEKLKVNTHKEFKDVTEESLVLEKKKLADRLDESALFDMRKEKLEAFRLERQAKAAEAAKAFAVFKQEERAGSGLPPYSREKLANIEYAERNRLFQEIKKAQLTADANDDYTKLLKARVVRDGSKIRNRGDELRLKYRTGSSGLAKQEGSIFKVETAAEKTKREASLDKLPSADDADESLAGGLDIQAIKEKKGEDEEEELEDLEEERKDELEEDMELDVDPNGYKLPKYSVTGEPTPPWIIHPQHPGKTAWDSVLAVVIIYSVLAVPFQIAFFRNNESDQVGWVIVDAVVDTLFGLDILVTFRTAYYDEDLLGWETNPNTIAETYARAPLGLFVDLVATIPWETLAGLVLSGGDAKSLFYVKLIRTVRLVRLAKLGKKAAGAPENDPRAPASASALASMILILLLIAHWLASMMYFMVDEEQPASWLNRMFGRQHVADGIGPFYKYALSIYWSVTTMTTVGWGDIVGTNKNEYFTVIVGMLIGSSVFGYVVGKVTMVVDGFDPSAAQLEQKSMKVRAYCGDVPLPRPLTRRVRAHFKHTSKVTSAFDMVASELGTNLPVAQACAIAYAQHRSLIESVPFLLSSPPVFVRELVSVLLPFVALPGEVVHREDDVGLCLFVLQKGTVLRFLELPSNDVGDELYVWVPPGAHAGLDLKPGRGGNEYDAVLAALHVSVELPGPLPTPPTPPPPPPKPPPPPPPPPRNWGMIGHGGRARDMEARRQAAVEMMHTTAARARAYITGAPADKDADDASSRRMSVQQPPHRGSVQQLAPFGFAGGALVYKVEPGSAADEAGVRPGMLLESVGGEPVGDDARALLARKRLEKKDLMLVVRTRRHREPFDVLHEGSVFGEAALLFNTNHQVTAIAAKERCELWYCPKNDLDCALGNWPLLRKPLAKRSKKFLRRVISRRAEHAESQTPEGKAAQAEKDEKLGRGTPRAPGESEGDSGATVGSGSSSEGSSLGTMDGNAMPPRPAPDPAAPKAIGADLLELLRTHPDDPIIEFLRGVAASAIKTMGTDGAQDPEMKAAVEDAAIKAAAAANIGSRESAAKKAAIKACKDLAQKRIDDAKAARTAARAKVITFRKNKVTFFQVAPFADNDDFEVSSDEETPEERTRKEADGAAAEASASRPVDGAGKEGFKVGAGLEGGEGEPTKLWDDGISRVVGGAGGMATADLIDLVCAEPQSNGRDQFELEEEEAPLTEAEKELAEIEAALALLEEEMVAMREKSLAKAREAKLGYKEEVKEEEKVEEVEDEDGRAFEELVVLVQPRPYDLWMEKRLFHPKAKIKTAWDLLICVVLLYAVVDISYQMGFDEWPAAGTAWFAMDTMMITCLWIDIVSTFNTAQYVEPADTKGALITDRRELARIYFKGWFAIDFVGTAPVDSFIGWAMGLGNRGSEDTVNLSALRLVRLLRLARLASAARILRKSSAIEKMEERFGFPPAVLKITKLLLLTMFFCHLSACFLYSMAWCDGGADCWQNGYCTGTPAGWFDDDDNKAFPGERGGQCYTNQEPFMKYVVVLYWAVTGLTSVGYGDIVLKPDAEHEVWMMTLVMLVGCMFYAYTLGALITVIVALDSGAKLRAQALGSLNEYLTATANTTRALRRALRVNLLQRMRVKSIVGEDEILASLPPTLRIAVVAVARGRALSVQAPLLCALEVAGRGALSVLLPVLKPYAFSLGDVILHPAIGSHRELFFVTNGALVVMTVEEGEPGFNPPPKAKAAPRAPSSAPERSPRGLTLHLDAPFGGGGAPATAVADADAARPSPRPSLPGQAPSFDLKGQGVNSRGGDPETPALQPKARVLERVGAAEVCGEAAFLMPDRCAFTLKVALRCGTPAATCLGLTRGDLENIKMAAPAIGHKLVLSLNPTSGKFRRLFRTWIEPPPGFAFRDLASDIESSHYPSPPEVPELEPESDEEPPPEEEKEEWAGQWAGAPKPYDHVIHWAQEHQTARKKTTVAAQAVTAHDVAPEKAAAGVLFASEGASMPPCMPPGVLGGSADGSRPSADAAFPPPLPPSPPPPKLHLPAASPRNAATPKGRGAAPSREPSFGSPPPLPRGTSSALSPAVLHAAPPRVPTTDAKRHATPDHRVKPVMMGKGGEPSSFNTPNGRVQSRANSPPRPTPARDAAGGRMASPLPTRSTSTSASSSNASSRTGSDSSKDTTPRSAGK